LLVEISHLTKYFGAIPVLIDVSASIFEKDRIGLVGVNGAGKSTLLQVICQMISHDEGSVTKPTAVRIGYLKQNSDFSPVGTVWEELQSVYSDVWAAEQKMKDVSDRLSRAAEGERPELMRHYEEAHAYFLSRDGYQLDVKMRTVLTGMGFGNKFDLAAQKLSGGEKTRLSIAKLLLEEPDLLILDEPTNHLDLDTLRWLEEYLLSYKGAILMVSHDRYFLDRTVEHIWELDHQRLHTYRGNYTAFMLQREERLRRQQKEYEMQQQKIASMQDFVARNIARASTSGSAKSRLHALERIELVEKPQERRQTATFQFPMDRPSHRQVLDIRSISVDVEGPEGHRTLFGNASLNAVRKERIAIVGRNGVGKTTFLKVLQGEMEPREGAINWGGAVNCAWYDQEQAQLHNENTVLEELWDRYPKMTQHQVKTILASIMFGPEDWEKRIKALSGGERARLLMAVVMLSGANVLLLDEPTNHLDFMTQEELERGLGQYEGTLLFVSHDRYLINKLATKIVEIKTDGFAVYEGNFDDYNHSKAVGAEKSQKDMPSHYKKTSSQEGYYRSKEQRAKEAKMRQRVKKLEQLIEDTQKKIEEVKEELQQPQVAQDYLLLGEKCTLIEDLENQHEKHLEEWMLLCEELDQ
jgi:ATP-binding cassette subfamily F protein 3